MVLVHWFPRKKLSALQAHLIDSKDKTGDFFKILLIFSLDVSGLSELRSLSLF